MYKNLLLITILFFFSGLQNVRSLEITGISFETYLGGEYNRTFNYSGDVSAIGSLQFNNIFKFTGGVSFGRMSGITAVKTLVKTGISPFVKIPLDFSFSWIYSGLPGFETNTNTLLPVISYNARRAGISIGCSFRFSSFFQENAQYESILSFSGYFNFFNNEMFQAGLIIGNFNDFNARNLGAISLKTNASFRINPNWLIVSEIELMQSGMDGLTTRFYGLACRTGARYSW